MNHRTTTVLLIVECEKFAGTIRQALVGQPKQPLDMIWVDSLESAAIRLSEKQIDIVLCDLDHPELGDTDILSQLFSQAPDTPVVALVHPSREQAGIDAMRIGAQDYLFSVDLDSSLLTHSLRRAIERQPMRGEFVQTIRDLQASEEKYRRLVESATDAIVTVGRNGRVRSINHVAEKLFGYTAAEVLGEELELLVPGRQLPDHEGLLRNTQEGHFAPDGRPLQVNGRRKTGELFPLELSLSKMIVGDDTFFTNVIRDSTERRRAEAEIHKLSRAVDCSPSMVLIYDIQGWIEYVNHKFTRVTGFMPSEIIGTNIVHLGANTEVEFDGIKAQLVEKGGEWRGEFRNEKKSGESYWVSVSISAILDSSGVTTHFVEVQEDITERRRSDQALLQRNRELTLLNRIIASIASILEPEIVLETVCRELTQAFDLNRASAVLLDETTGDLELIADNAAGPIASGHGTNVPPDLDMLSQQILTNKLPVTGTLDQVSWPPSQSSEPIAEAGTRPVLLVPLLILDQVLGIIQLEAKSGREFAKQDVELAASASAATAHVLVNARLYSEAKENMARLTSILELSTELTDIQHESELVETLVERTATLSQSPFCALMLVDEKSDDLVLIAQQGLSDVSSGARMSTSLPEVQRSLRTAEPIILTDIDADAPPLRPYYLRADVQSLFAYPMVRRERVLGFIAMGSLISRRPSAYEITAYRLLADRVAVSLENARLLAELQKRNLELNRLHRASGTLFAGTMSGLEGLVQDIAETIQQEFEHSNCSVFLVDEDMTTLRRLKAVGPFAGRLQNWNFPIDGRGLVPESVRTGRIVNVPHVKSHPAYIEGWEEIRSELAIPLKVGDRVIGAIDLQSTEAGAFDENDEHLLATFAGRAALAIQNTRLFSESKRRAEALESLRLASLQLSSTLELQQVLSAILEYGIRLIGAVDAHAFLLQDDKLSFGAALWADGSSKSAYTTPRPGGLTDTVARTGRRIVVPDVDAHPLFQDWQWGGAIIGLPLSKGDRVLGVVNVAFDKPRHFDDNELQLLDLLATQAALAVDNTRLFNETRRRAEEMEAIVSVSSALRRAETQTEMLPIILDEVFSLLDAEGAVLALYDDDSDEKTLSLGRGAWSQVAGLQLPKDQDATEKLLSIINHRADDAVPKDWRAVQRETGGLTYAAACVPLITREETIGELWVGCEKGITQSEFKILTAVADIAANAMRRSTLHEEMRLHAEVLERRVNERTYELSLANAELERAVRAKDEFLASMSHELRTPLNNALVRVEMLREGMQGEINQKQARSLQIIEESGRHLLDLINDVLDVSKIEAGKLELDPQPIAVESICQSSLQLVKQMALRKQIQIETDIESAVMMADGRRLKQILVNLLSNAVKFTPDGGTIGLNVATDNEAHLIRFTVWDTGIGIAQDDTEYLFRPFTQVDSGLTRKYEGTGLGLTLVRQLAQMHNGEVTLESELGAGSRFIVSLPWQLDAKLRSFDEARLKEHSQKKSSSFHLPPPTPVSSASTILLAEDNEIMITALLEIFPLHGYQVVTARSGAEAIERANEVEPDLILMDIQMPGMDGLEAIRRIRAQEKFQKIPIVALTALAMSGDRERCLEAGASEYLSKPIDLQKLTDVMRAQLAASQRKEKART